MTNQVTIGLTPHLNKWPFANASIVVKSLQDMILSLAEIACTSNVLNMDMYVDIPSKFSKSITGLSNAYKLTQ